MFQVPPSVLLITHLRLSLSLPSLNGSPPTFSSPPTLAFVDHTMHKTVVQRGGRFINRPERP